MIRMTSTCRLAVLALILLGAGCGKDPFRGPWIRLRFALDFDRAVREGRIRADADRHEVAAGTLAVIRDRIDRTGLDLGVRVYDDDAFAIFLPVDLRPSLESIVDLVMAVGDLQFRVEVLPSSFYRAWQSGRTPPRLEQASTSPWKGSIEEFEAFKRKEVEAFLEAREAAAAYEPSHPRYFVVPRHATEAAGVHDFAVLEEPQSPAHAFSGTALKNPVTSKDPSTGRPLVLYEVKAELQDAFEEWTGQNVGLPLAIVLDGVYRSAPVITSRLRDYVQITLGAGSSSELESEAQELATVLQSGSLPIRPALVSVDDPERGREDR